MSRQRFLTFLVCIIINFVNCLQNFSQGGSKPHEHLIVLAHGIVGTKRDLGYLAGLLKSKGCHVLLSSANEKLQSLGGIEVGAARLVEEILHEKRQHPHLKSFSLVGNSLGGLYTRFAARILYSDPNFDLVPKKFMTIATPHVGVEQHNYIEEKLKFSIPSSIKSIIARTMWKTGIQLFLQDDNKLENTLLYRMASSDEFLLPLQSFEARRLYANIDQDFVVPLGTSALFKKSMVKSLRDSLDGGRRTGIVLEITDPKKKETKDSCRTVDSTTSNQESVDDMIDQLDAIGWEKVLCIFPSVIPLAHNKICALERSPPWLYSSFLGFDRGKEVMDHAAIWLAEES